MKFNAVNMRFSAMGRQGYLSFLGQHQVIIISLMTMKTTTNTGKNKTYIRKMRLKFYVGSIELLLANENCQ